MSGELLLIGSIPYDTGQEVFEKFGAPLGKYLLAMPDGAVGPDQFEYNGQGEGGDTITDFTSGADRFRILVSGFNDLSERDRRDGKGLVAADFDLR